MNHPDKNQTRKPNCVYDSQEEAMLFAGNHSKKKVFKSTIQILK